MILHGYWRSGASYRVRIALNLKGVAYEQATYDLREGRHREAAFTRLNPQALVPALETEDGLLTQSPAILEWLEERYPDPPLLPSDRRGRALVRSMAGIICCDIHPLNNLRVLKSLRSDLGADDHVVQRWIARWIVDGFAAIEAMMADHGGIFAYGDCPTFADCCLVPQIFAAERFDVDLTPFPKLRSAAAHARAMPAFIDAAPERQGDADQP
jgi:maleylpyruvate isomerase